MCSWYHRGKKIVCGRIYEGKMAENFPKLVKNKQTMCPRKITTKINIIKTHQIVGEKKKENL